ncbi:MAG: hypothetical protein AAGG68_15945 [Bacteroidota bacterium]
MKQLFSLFLFCCILHPAQAQEDNDSIRILLFPFEVSGEVLDQSLSIKVPDKLQETLVQDFLFINTDDVTRLRIKGWLYRNEPDIKKSDLEILRLRAPNYYIKGTIYSDQITVKVFRYPENIQVLVETRKWKLPERSFPFKPVESIADAIWSKLQDSYGAAEADSKLIIQSKNNGELVQLNGKTLGSMEDQQTLPVNRARSVRIAVGKDHEIIKLDDNFINRVKIKRKGESHKIVRSASSLQLSSGISRFEEDFAYSTDLALKFLLRKGFSLGVQAQYFWLYHRYDYSTLEGIPPNRLRQESQVLNFAVLGSYDRYLSSVKLIWHTDAYAILFPEFGGGIRSGIAHESFPQLQLRLGYQWFPATVEQAVFNPFGNASFEKNKVDFGGLYIGISLQEYL